MGSSLDLTAILMKHWMKFLLICGLCVGAQVSGLEAQNSRVQIEMVNSYPELRVEGEPFFIHSAAFFYSRLPRDQWETALLKHRELGINTLDLYLQWNWHEPQEGQVDFDGHTNPRRDLQGLLQLVSRLGFKLIIRPGPVILNEWKNGGYPDWLLVRPEYKEELQDVLEGRYPRLSNLSPSQSEEASRQWIENETHLRYTRHWFLEAMKVLSPYLASQGGNILFFQLDDDQAINRSNYNGPNFWRYMQTLRRDLVDAAVAAGGRPEDIIAFINPTDMRVSAAGFSPALERPIAAMGQWYMNSENSHLGIEDSANLQFFVEELKTQPAFPAMMIEFQAGWYISAEDTFAKNSDPANTLLASRTLFAHGLRGLNYFPLQDTLYPAGYEVPWTNHYYAWESAINLNSYDQPRSDSVRRNGNLIRGLGKLLAQTHKQADVGIVYPMGALQPQEKLGREDIRLVSNTTLSVQQYLALNHVSQEYVDPEYQAGLQLARHRVLWMPVIPFDPSRGISLSQTAQQRLAEFVQRGGTLIFFPRAPESGLLGEWFSGLKRTVVKNGKNGRVTFISPDSPPLIPDGDLEVYEPTSQGETSATDFEVFAHFKDREFEAAIGLKRRIGLGKVLLLGMDFFSWAARKNGENGAIASSPSAAVATLDIPGSSPLSFGFNSVVDELMNLSSISRTVNWSVEEKGADRSQVALELGRADDCSGFGFLSLINFSLTTPQQVKVSTSEGERCLAGATLPTINLQPKDSLLLPLHVPLSGFLPGFKDAEIVASNAELVSVEGDSDRFRLTIYSPTKSELILKLPEPSQWKFRVDVIPLTPIPDLFSGWIRLEIPAGFPPLNHRMIEISKSKFSPGTGFGSKASVTTPRTVPGTVPSLSSSIGGGGVFVKMTTDYVLPIREGLAMALDPPILVLDSSKPSRFSLQIENPTSRAINFGVDLFADGFRLSSSLKKLKVEPHSVQQFMFSLYLFLKRSLDPKTKVSHGRIRLKSHHEVIEKTFTMLTIDAGTAVAFAKDLDRDGFDEVVLENSALRLILTPHEGARAFVLIDKIHHQNLFTSIGAFRDKFSFNKNEPNWTTPRRVRGYYGMFNRPYQYEIISSGGNVASARFFYEAPDVLPGGALVHKIVSLHADLDYFDVEYLIMPHLYSGSVPQSFISSTSVVSSGSGSPLPLNFELIGTTQSFLEREEIIPREHSKEILLHFKKFEASPSTYTYKIRYRLIPNR